MDTLLERIDGALTDDEIEAGAKALKETFSATIVTQLKQAFKGVGFEFFQMYASLQRDLHKNQPLTPDKMERIREIWRTRIVKNIDDVFTRERLDKQFTDWYRESLRLANRGFGNRLQITQFLEGYISIMDGAARSQNVYFKRKLISKPAFYKFGKMREEDIALEKIGAVDPAYYDKAMELKLARREVRGAIEERLKAAGYKTEIRRMGGKIVVVALPKEATDEELFFDEETEEGLTKEAYLERLREQQANEERITRVFPPPNELDALRVWTDEEIAEALKTNKVRSASITDDMAKEKGVARFFDVVDIEDKNNPMRRPDGSTVVDEFGSVVYHKQPVIASGKYKGIRMDDMVNATGRLIEGSAYLYDHKTGRRTRMEVETKAGMTVNVDEEAYATVRADGKLYLRLPSYDARSGEKSWTERRRQMRALANKDPWVMEQPSKDRKEIMRTFIFEPEAFESVQAICKSLSLSKAALARVEAYYENLARREYATSRERLDRFDAQAIGGFKDEVEIGGKFVPLQFLSVQKQALAFLDARGDNGVVALDTGTGKTLVTLAHINKLRKEGTVTAEARVLFVCPASLTGNLHSQGKQFLADEDFVELFGAAADKSAGLVDVMSYAAYTRAMTADPNFMDQYAVVYFDEAQALKGNRSKVGKFATLPHPRKVFLSASPMETDPKDVYKLVRMSENVDWRKREERQRARDFERNFCEVIGGRACGISQDPTRAQRFQEWVKQNIYFADKRSVEEFALPRLTRVNQCVRMAPEVEREYRATMKRIGNVMQMMVRRYRDKDRATARSGVERAKIQFRKEFKRLHELANMPDSMDIEQPIAGARNPKLEQAASLIKSGMEGGRRAILFTDDPKVATYYGQRLSKLIPGTIHAVGLSNAVNLYMNGKQIDPQYRAKEYPVEKASGRPVIVEGQAAQANERFFVMVNGKKTPINRADVAMLPVAQWKVHVLKNFIAPVESGVVSCVLTSSYSQGHNLQAFTDVIHIDRDTWNSEEMKQRCARVWRQGQKNPVTETFLDAVFDDPSGDLDRTMDEIRGFAQQMEEDL